MVKEEEDAVHESKMVVEPTMLPFTWSE